MGVAPKEGGDVTDGLLMRLPWTIIRTISFFVIRFHSPTCLVLSRVPFHDSILLCVLITFSSMTHTCSMTQPMFHTIQYCSFPRTCILGIPASGGTSKPSSLV